MEVSIDAILTQQQMNKNSVNVLRSNRKATSFFVEISEALYRYFLSLLLEPNFCRMKLPVKFQNFVFRNFCQKPKNTQNEIAEILLSKNIKKPQF